MSRAGIYPNLLLSEMNVDGPLQCIVSNMTAFYVKGIYYKLTLYLAPLQYRECFTPALDC